MRKIFGSELLFLFFLGSLCFWCGFAYGFCVFSCNFAPEVLSKTSLDVRSCFCLVLSVLGFGLTTFFVLFLSLFPFFFEEIELRANRTPHTPPHVLLFFFFLSPPLCLVRLFWPCVLFVLGFSSGCHSGPRALFGFSRDCSEAFFLDARR